MPGGRSATSPIKLFFSVTDGTLLLIALNFD
jgi:hypothetical protein